MTDDKKYGATLFERIERARRARQRAKTILAKSKVRSLNSPAMDAEAAARRARSRVITAEARAVLARLDNELTVKWRGATFHFKRKWIELSLNPGENLSAPTGRSSSWMIPRGPRCPYADIVSEAHGDISRHGCEDKKPPSLFPGDQNIRKVKAMVESSVEMTKTYVIGYTAPLDEN